MAIASRACIGLSLWALACTPAAADPPAVPAATGGDPSHRSTGRARVRFALARHLERAELRHGETLHVELGAVGGARHTAGGWLSNVGPDRVIDDADASITTSSRARFALAGRGRAAELSVRLRTFRPGTARLYLDGAEIASGSMAADRWTLLSASLGAEQLPVGEHELLVRFDRGRALEGVGRAYAAVDWIRLGPADGPPPSALPSASDVDGVPALRLPAGWSVGYPFEVPAGARLRGVVRGAGRLEVWATREGESERRLATVAASEAPRRFDVDLAALGGELARIDLRATAALTLFRPAVITLDGQDPRHSTRPRHVLIYLIDTLRADRLSPYAPDTRVRTPGFSGFARGASTFTSARSQENWTKPSVATLLSSLMPWEHTAFSDGSVVPPTVRLLPEMLNERGFATAGFVANGYVSRRFGFRRGWDTWRNYIREGRRTRGEELVADALAWIDDERPADQPFFLYVHAIDPHVPYRAPERYLAMYDAEPYHGPVDFSRDATLLESIKTGALRLGARDRQRLEALYDAEVTYQDAQLAALLDGLARRGLADDTLVVITADHGEELFDHGSVGHGHSLYEELVHVPLAIRWPGLSSAPRRVEGAVGLVDVVPTVLDALGEPIPDDLSGRSLVPMLRGDGEGAPPTSVSEFMQHWRSVTVGRYKLVARSRGRYALFDLREDPGEQHDLSSERPMTVAYLRGLLGLRLAESRGSDHRPRRRHRARAATIDPELEAQLRALGYVGTSRPR